MGKPTKRVYASVQGTDSYNILYATWDLSQYERGGWRIAAVSPPRWQPTWGGAWPELAEYDIQEWLLFEEPPELDDSDPGWDNCLGMAFHGVLREEQDDVSVSNQNYQAHRNLAGATLNWALPVNSNNKHVGFWAYRTDGSPWGAGDTGMFACILLVQEDNE